MNSCPFCNIMHDIPPQKREPAEFIALEMPTVEQANAEIERVRKANPRLTDREILLYICLRASAEVSGVVQGSDGGGRYPRFLETVKGRMG